MGPVKASDQGVAGITELRLTTKPSSKNQVAVLTDASDEVVAGADRNGLEGPGPRTLQRSAPAQVTKGNAGGLEGSPEHMEHNERCVYR